MLPAAQVEPSLAGAAPGGLYQFERQGYFCVDSDSAAGHPVFNRSVSLKSEYQPEKSQPNPVSHTKGPASAGPAHPGAV